MNTSPHVERVLRLVHPEDMHTVDPGTTAEELYEMAEMADLEAAQLTTKIQELRQQRTDAQTRAHELRLAAWHKEREGRDDESQ